ncbi:monocarboxylate transporter 13-like [Neosynchiropus ocellatus]
MLESKKPGANDAVTSSEPASEKQREEEEGPDGGWGWVMVAAGFVTTALVYGVMRGMGVFFVEFDHYFDEGAQTISWIPSAALAIHHICSLLGTALCKTNEPRYVVMVGGFLSGLGMILGSLATRVVHLFLSISLLTGVGWGLAYAPLLSIVMASFTRRRNMAISVVLSSISLSAFAFNPLFQLFVDSYTWRGALLIVGGMSFNIMASGALIRRQLPPKAPAKVTSQRRSISAMLQQVSSSLELSLLLERPFVTYSVACIFFILGYFVPFFHLVAHSQQVGFSEYQSAFVVSTACAGELVGRLLSGVCILLLPLRSVTGSYPALVMMSLFYGLNSGAISTLIYSLIPIFTGPERMMGGLGLLQVITSLGGLLGAPLSGLMKDLTGTYLMSFVVAGLSVLLFFAINATIPRFFSCTDPPVQQRLLNTDHRDRAEQRSIE